MSGRRTSLASVLVATGVPANALTINPHAPREFLLADRIHMVARVSSVRASLHYENPDDLRLDQGVRLELDWLLEADGLVFVLDSQASRGPANREEFLKLERDLAHRGVDVKDKPIVFQANKRDLSNLIAMRDVQDMFGASQCYVESVAPAGVGTLEAVVALASLMHDA
jgi:hypothetical protein